jgi:hypothetical protein
MIVARQFIAWYPVRKREPSRRDGMIRDPGLLMVDEKTRRVRQSPRLYETGPFFNVSQAINCLATITQSRRDEGRQRP